MTTSEVTITNATTGGVYESAAAPIATSAAAVVWMLAYREWVRFFRQRNRVIGALGQPILFWLLFGTGMHAAFRGGEQDFITFYVPGTLVLILLFTAIFTTISIIEDRREGFLQNVLVAPVPRWTIAAGKVLGGAAIAWLQAGIFLLLTLATGSVPLTSALLGVLLMMAVAALALTALGVFFAWPMESTQGFHAVMNLVLMPLWLLSGAFFPIPQPGVGSPVGQWIMHWLMRSNPLSYTIGGLRTMMGVENASPEFWTPGLVSSWSVTIAFLLITLLAAWGMVLRPAKGDMR